MSTRAKQKQQTPSPKLVTWSGPDAVPESVKPRLLRETLHVFHDMPFLPWSEMEVTLTVAVDGTWFPSVVLTGQTKASLPPIHTSKQLSL